MTATQGSDTARGVARDDAGDRRALYNGFGNALATAVELTVTPLLFVLAGGWLDGHFGTGRAFTIALGVLAVAGMAVRSYYAYQARIRLDEEGKPWARPRR